MGGGWGKPKRKYTLTIITHDASSSSIPSAPTTLEQHKKPVLKRTHSDPKVLNDTTIFCPYVDLNVGRKGSAKVVQRAVSKSKSTLIGEGKLDYKRSDFYELSGRFPWLLKNAHFVQPQLKDFIVGRMIGAGRFSKVHVARTSRNKYFALKVLNKQTVFKTDDTRHVLSERNALYEVHSPFCMKLFAEFEDSTGVYFAVEYVPGGELRTLLLTHHNKFSLDMAKFYLAEVFAAIEHIHSVEYCFRDLRPDNICIDEEGHIKLVDFGFCVDAKSNVNGKLYTICCGPAYLSPELLNSKWTGGYSKEVDWWAYGVMAYEMVVGGLPFGDDSLGNSTYEILLNILNHNLKIPTFMDGKTKDLLHKLLEPDLSKRLLEASAIKSHAFFHDITSWDDVNARKLLPPYIPALATEGDSSHYRMEASSAKHWKLQGLENKVHIL